MRIKMLEQITGTRDGKAWPARGQEMDLPDHEAARLCAAGRAVPVVVEERVETATAPAPEVREAPTKRTRPRAPRA